MSRYVPLHDGTGIVSLPVGFETGAIVYRTENALAVLDHYRTREPSGCKTLDECTRDLANELAAALVAADEIRNRRSLTPSLSASEQQEVAQ